MSRKSLGELSVGARKGPRINMAHALSFLGLDTKHAPSTTVGLLITTCIFVLAGVLERTRAVSWAQVLRAWCVIRCITHACHGSDM